MRTKSRRPRWWLLYLILPILLALFWLISQDGLPDWANAWFTVGVLVMVAVFVELWLHANASLLLFHPEDGCDPASDSTGPLEGSVPLPGAAADGRARSPRVIGRVVTELGTMPVLSFGCDSPDADRRGEAHAAVPTPQPHISGGEP